MMTRWAAAPAPLATQAPGHRASVAGTPPAGSLQRRGGAAVVRVAGGGFQAGGSSSGRPRVAASAAKTPPPSGGAAPAADAPASPVVQPPDRDSRPHAAGPPRAQVVAGVSAAALLALAWWAWTIQLLTPSALLSLAAGGIAAVAATGASPAVAAQIALLLVTVAFIRVGAEPALREVHRSFLHRSF